MNAVVQQQVSGILKNGHGISTCADQSVQVIGGVIGHGKHAVLHVQDDKTAMLGQLERIFLPVTVGDIGFVVFQPVIRDQFLFLNIARIVDVFSNGAFCDGLIGCVQCELDIVAVLRGDILQFTHNLGTLVTFNDPVAGLGGGILGQPVFHG